MLDPVAEEEVVVVVRSALGVRAIDRTELVQPFLDLSSKCLDVLRQHLVGRQRADEEPQVERVAVTRIDRLVPPVERPLALGADPVERLVGTVGLPDRPAMGKAVLHEPRQQRVQLRARGRPDVADRLPRVLEQVVAGVLAFEREEREDGGLRGGQRPGRRARRGHC